MTNLIWPQTDFNPWVALVHRTLKQLSDRDQPNPTKQGQQKSQASFNQGELGPADV